MFTLVILFISWGCHLEYHAALRLGTTTSGPHKLDRHQHGDVSNSVRGGSALSDFQCFTFDEGRTDAEYICGTTSGTSVASLTRGYRHEHAR